jgi:hypothetical protein
MITIKDASIYSMSGSMVYQLEYSQGTFFRFIMSKDSIIKCETKDKANNWVQSGKPYTVVKNKKRQAKHY